MGVMSCSRRGCDNVMCDRYSPEFGHICHECFNELVALGPQTLIPTFMDSVKPKGDMLAASHAYYNAIFPARR